MNKQLFQSGGAIILGLIFFILATNIEGMTEILIPFELLIGTIGCLFIIGSIFMKPQGNQKGEKF